MSKNFRKRKINVDIEQDTSVNDESCLSMWMNDKGAVRMRVKKRKIICLILAVLIPLSGMYYINFKAGSSLIYAVSAEKVNSYIRSVDEKTQDMRLCTTEMLEGLDYSDNQQYTGVFVGQKRDARTVLRFLYLNNSCNKKRIFKCSEAMLHEQLVTSYIHKLDGKKRI